MASTTALFTAMTGLNASARNIDVIGNNIANINTTAFKSSRLVFSTMFSRTLSGGTAPGDTTGGTNPYQIGLGVATSGTQRNMAGGTLTPTGDQRDLAIDGKGWFVVDRGGDRMYTRAGSFRTNALNQLTTVTGESLQGYGVDENFQIVPGQLTSVSIPVGQMTIAEETRTVRFSGNLDADGPLPGQGSRVQLGATASSGFMTIAGASPAPTPPNQIEPTTRLVDIEDPSLSGSGTPLFAAGQQLELRGAEKGSRTVGTSALTITPTSTLADLAAFLSTALGIDTSTGANPDGGTPGVAVDNAMGTLGIIGNTGSANDLSIDTSDIRLNDASGNLVRYPFTSTKTAEADGESVRTSFVVFDSLGAPVDVDITMVLDSRSSSGTTWRYYAESPDNGAAGVSVGTGTISFDTQGQPVSSLPVTVSIDRSATGAGSPLAMSFYFESADGGVTSLADTGSSLAATYRDGAPMGTLTAFSVGSDGVITGIFTNDLTRTLGQVVLAGFTNDEGLLDMGNSLFKSGSNSGPAMITEPGALGTGRLVGGALEQSNVDLGEEFIKLVLSSTGYSANSRVIRTTDELMQQLLVLGR